MQDETRDPLDRKRKISDETGCAVVGALSMTDEEPKARKRKKPNCKERMPWDQRREDLEDWEFRRTYRMTRPTSDCVLRIIRPRLCKDESKARTKAQAAEYNFIEPELRLSMTLRFLAGEILHLCM